MYGWFRFFRWLLPLLFRLMVLPFMLLYKAIVAIEMVFVRRSRNQKAKNAARNQAMARANAAQERMLQVERIRAMATVAQAERQAEAIKAMREREMNRVRKSRKCSTCGAPIVTDATECRYCKESVMA